MPSSPRARLDEFAAGVVAGVAERQQQQPAPQPAPEPKKDDGGGGFWGSVGGAVGAVGSGLGGAVRVAGGAVDTFGDAGDRIGSWMNPHNNGSKEDFLASEQKFYQEHGTDQSKWDVDDRMDQRELESTRPHGLEPSNEWNVLGSKLKGGGNAIEATGKFGETFIREPAETAEFAWDNKGEIAHGVTEYTKHQFSREAIAEWAMAAGAAATIATARSGAAKGGAVEPVPTPHMEAPAPHLEAPAPHVAEPNLSRPASSPVPKVEFPEVVPAESAPASNTRMGRLDRALAKQMEGVTEIPESPLNTSRLSRSAVPTLFPKTQQWMANIIAGSPEATGIIPSVRRMIARSRFEPQGIEPSARPNSTAAAAGTSPFTEAMWENKTWGGRAAKAKLAWDIATLGEGKDDPDQVTEALDAYDPKKVSDNLGAYNDFANGRSARRVAFDTLTDPSEQSKALEAAEAAGFDPSKVSPAITDFAKGHMPNAGDYVIPGALAVGGLAAAALKSGIIGGGKDGGDGGDGDVGSGPSRVSGSGQRSGGGEGVRSPERVGYSSGSYSSGRGFQKSSQSLQSVSSEQNVRDPYAGGGLTQRISGEAPDPYRKEQGQVQAGKPYKVRDPYREALSPLKQPVRT